MPLIYTDEPFTNVSVGVWRADEEESFFEQGLELYSEEVNELTNTSSRKQIEWLSSRYLLQNIMQKNYRMATVKDGYGKPYLIGSEKHISLSHSSNFTAAIVADSHTGIDIQYITEKLIRVKHKFLSPEEMEYYELTMDLLILHVYWGAKEALFKAYGKGGVDFKKQLYVEPFEIAKSGKTKGYVYKDDTIYAYELKFIIDEKFILVYIVKPIFD
jgi:4'-phosphopantetheinyl transferase